MEQSCNAGERVIVGMRAAYKAENGEQDALLILGGEHAGELIVEAYLNGPALDIGAQVEIIAREAIPFGTTAIPFLRAGVLLRHETGTNVYFVVFRKERALGASASRATILIF